MRNLFRQSSRRQQRRLLKTLSAEVQSLEQRTLPAGTVTASFTGGNITLNGDSNDNQVQIDVLPTGTTITGLSGTLIKFGARSTSSLSVPNITVRDVTVNLKAGDDSLTVNVGEDDDEAEAVDLVIGRNLKIDAGAGNDTVNLTVFNGTITVNGGLTVDLGAGNDSLTALHEESDEPDDEEESDLPIQVLGNVKITGSTGNDGVGLADFATGKDLTIETGSGNDSVELLACEVGGNANVALSAGEDSLDVESSTVTGQATFDGGSNDDAMSLVDSLFESLVRVNLQAGDDDLTLASEFRGVLDVIAGSGDDQVAIGDADFQADSSIKLGTGDDELTVDGEPSLSDGVSISVDAGLGIDTLFFNSEALAALGLSDLKEEDNSVFEIKTEIEVEVE